MSLTQFWGKQRPRRSDADGAYHPAAYHCLDVAASALAILEAGHALRSRICVATGLSDEQALAAIPALIALHDVGKFSAQFHRQVPDLWLPEMGNIATAPGAPGHGVAGAMLWHSHLVADLADRFPNARRLSSISRAIMGHHGSPIPDRAPISVAELYRPHGLACARQFAREVVDMLMPSPVTISTSPTASWLVAGLTVVADWVGSSANFPYTPDDMPLATYWHERALPIAHAAVREFGLAPCASSVERDLEGLMSDARFRDPTPMQRWASSVDLVTGPGLYVIEDSTGAGKTEAALMLAHRLIAAGRADGVYFALPTMATANGLYRRLGAAYRRLFVDDANPSLVLAHAARDIDPAFRQSILDYEAEEGAGAQCSEWIGDNRRAAFLAQVGVGTVDQAILAVLPSTHQSLRLMGLSQRVLVIDEAHAYDAYMGQEIAALLQFHAALGGSAIVLSATLPEVVKSTLVEAYGGARYEASASYPLATVVRAGAVEQTPVAPRVETVRRVPVRFVDAVLEAERIAVGAARDGQAVLYIRNTIRDARETYDRVSADVNARLFHARFAQVDRARIETEALTTYGRESTPEMRRGQLLIATQVVEQSLDLDFDLIVTDLAPIDLLIQRAGRLWRHNRERVSSATRQMIVVSPDPVDNPSADWISAVMPGTGRVYSDHATLWLSARLLREIGEIDAPDGLRPLVEGVYAPGARAAVPQGLTAVARRADDDRRSNRGLAHQRVLRHQDGYALTAQWQSDDDIATRLGDASTTVRLAVRHADGDGLLPLAALTERDERDWRRLWALSEVRVPAWLVSTHVDTPEVIAELAQWPAWMPRERCLVVLTPDDGIWRGDAMGPEDRSGNRPWRRVTYSRHIGFHAE